MSDQSDSLPGTTVAPGAERIAVFDVPSLRGVRPHKYNLGAWSDHVPFAFDLMAELKPRLFVELGTHHGESYFAFCQSARENKVDVRCYAVDTWQGEAQAGFYSEEVYKEVAEHNRRHYAAFSYLTRGTFEQAHEQFADNTVDLLHIDGLHTYEAARNDFNAWLPKVRAGGIVLMHDICVRQEGYGVWKVWDEIGQWEGIASGQDGPGFFAFHHGWGLGVFQKGPRPEPASAWLQALLGGDPRQASAFRHYYRLVADHLRMARNGGDPDLRAGYEALRADRANAQIIMETQATELARLREDGEVSTRRIVELEEVVARQRAEVKTLASARLEEASARFDSQEAELARLQAALAALRDQREQDQQARQAEDQQRREKRAAENGRIEALLDTWQAAASEQRKAASEQEGELKQQREHLARLETEAVATQKRLTAQLDALSRQVAKPWWRSQRSLGGTNGENPA